MKIGYMRVSTEKQVTDLQRDALMRAGCDKLYEDKISGTKISRDGLDACMAQLAAGDVLVVWKLDRLGRSLSHLMKIMGDLKTRGIEFESLTEKIDTGTPSGELLLHVIGALAQFERSIIRERVKAGVEAARGRGKRLGRPPTISGTGTVDRVKQLDADGISQGKIARMLGISQASVSRVLTVRASGDNV